MLRDEAARFDQLLSLINQAGTGGSSPFGRCWVEAASEIPIDNPEYAESLDTSEAVATIRSTLSLQMKELANVLGVSRPTVYSWLRDEEKPQPQNRQRIARLLKFAKAWNSLSKSPIGATVRNELGEDGKSLVDLFTESSPNDVAIFSRMQSIVEAKATKPKGIHEIAKRHGIDLTKVRESQAEFDVLTGKPFHED
ncbi:MAG: helix-turn-helix domain-containing protein [Pirellulaceae bacterium]